MKEYLSEISAVMAEQKTSDLGLSEDEAAARLSEHGPNKLKEEKKESLFHKFLKELADPMIIILIVAAVISGITAIYSNESFADVIIIMAVVVINSVLGVFQESKAEKAISALQEISAATTRVIRNGNVSVIKSEDLVPGDIIVLEAGDSVPADARVIESASMKTEESALTGESVPVNKISGSLEAQNGDIPLGDRKNMIYIGSTVTYGRGKAIVTATGMNTELGKIADALTKAKNEDTPLQKKLAQLSKLLSFLVLGICVFIFAFDVFRLGSNLTGEALLDTFMVAVSLAVAAIPEGLAAVVTIVLSIGVTNMSKRNAIIRKLTAVETLGCTEIICSDKTGTLTQNKMTVVETFTDDETMTATSFALCTDATLTPDLKHSEGDPTQTAVVDFALTLGLPKYELEEKYPRIGEIPFSSERKLMTTVHKPQSGSFIQHTTGAPDVTIKKCNRILRDGKVIPITEDIRKELFEANKKLADKALRVLAAAYREYTEPPVSYEPDEMENDLIFLGLYGMIDPIRPEVKVAIDQCRRAGIRPIMITGDHKDTAAAIASQLGILTPDTVAVTGEELNSVSDEELKENITKYSVYARVQPEHKVRIVNAWRANGYITAMTGDGVNDAPAIKSADIGVGMGITGTDVTKNVADMVLADDNFATIVSAVEEGRRIYDNVRKSIQFLLSSNLAEVMSIFVSTLLGFTILSPVHLLWINLITDCFPALALGMEKAEPDVMERAPRDSKESIFAGGMGSDIAIEGVFITALTLISYFVGHFMEADTWSIGNSADGMTMAFLTLSLVEIFHCCNTRSRRRSLFSLKSTNKWIIGAMIFSLVLTTSVLYIPFLRSAFGFTSVSLAEYAIAALLAFMIIPIMEVKKLICRALKK